MGRGCMSWGEQRTRTGYSDYGLLSWRPSVGWAAGNQHMWGCQDCLLCLQDSPLSPQKGA